MSNGAPASATSLPKPSPESSFRLPGFVLLAGFCLAAAGACLDYNLAFPLLNIQKYHTLFCYGFLGLLVFSDREPEAGRRLRFTLAALAGTFLLAYVMRHAVRDFPLREEISSDRLIEMITLSPAPYLWTVALWLAAPVLRDEGGCYSRTLRAAGWALMVYGALCLASAVASQRPEKSLSLFYHERALTFALLFAWLRAAQTAPALRAGTARFVVWLLAALMLAGTVVGMADLFGPESLRARLVEMNDADHKLVRLVTAVQTETTVLGRRLQYPMLHFNRTAYLALMALMAIFIASFPLRPRRGLDRWSLVGLAPSFFVMILSYTRGVTAAAVAALCAWAALVSRRALAAILVLCVVMAAAIPAAQRQHFLSIFKPSTYRIERASMTSMALRIMGWEYGLGIMRQMPLSGLGYGTRIVRDDYIRHIKASGNRRLIHDVQENAVHQHMHNLWLEIAVESGLPALLAFMVFTAARWAMLGRALWRSRGPLRRRMAAWLAFELSILIAGTIYYMLKHNFGMINFFVWGFMLSEFESLDHGAVKRALALNSRGGIPVTRLNTLER